MDGITRGTVLGQIPEYSLRAVELFKYDLKHAGKHLASGFGDE